MKKTKYMVAIMGKDKPGIIANITQALAESKCNLEDISMTVLEDQFSMMLIVESGKPENVLATHLDKRLKNKSLSVFWKKMSGVKTGQKHLRGSDTWIVTAVGKDRAGIVASVSAVLGKHKLNITDLNCKILPMKAKQPLYALMLEVDIPKKFSQSKLQTSFNRLSKTLKMEISMRRFESMEF